MSQFIMLPQYMNHFPGMNEISRKDSLGRNMERYVIL